MTVARHNLDFLHQRQDFSGSKIALLEGDRVLTILRDDLPTIPYPNTWDLPGGGKENDETPFECVQREVAEELAIDLKPETLVWARTYQGIINPDKKSVFMVATISQEDLDNICFGDEGQGYKMMKITDFLEDETIIYSLRKRLLDYVERD